MGFTSNNDPQAKKLVEEGIAAIKGGDKQLGRGKLEAAVKMDAYNEQAWLWLARVVTTAEERRTCLNNVLLINPSNAEAQKLLEKIEGIIDKRGTGALGIIQAQPRRNRLLLGVLGLLILILVCVVGFTVIGGGEEEVAVPTAFVTETFTPTLDLDATATALASITPTATITPSIVPATWTFTPAPTETTPPQQFPTPPAEVPGRVIMQSGRVAGDLENQPIVVMPPGNPAAAQTVSADGQRGQLPALMAGQNRFAWAQYSSGTRSLTLQIQEFTLPNAINVTSLYGSNPVLNDPNYPTWSGNNLVFSAQLLGAPVRDLWLIPVSGSAAPTPLPSFGDEVPTLEPTPTIPPTVEQLGTEAVTDGTATIEPTPVDSLIPAGSPLVRLTNNVGDNTWSAFDATGTALVFVSSDDGVTDLRVVNINSLQVFVLTENQNELVEAAPDWNADNEIIFAASAQGADASDIYIMKGDLSEGPSLLIDLGPHDIQPRFSPDGRYVVFSSDYYGDWDVFIFDRQTETIYQLVVNPQSIDIANDWTE